MTAEDKITFVTELTESIRMSVIADIEAGKTPDDWNGIELRRWLADRFIQNTMAMNRKRKSAYLNTVNVNNL